MQECENLLKMPSKLLENNIKQDGNGKTDIFCNVIYQLR